MKRWTAWTAILLSVCLICLCCVSLADNSGAYEDDDAIWAAPGGMAGPGGASSGPSSGTSSGPRGPWEDPALVSGPWDSSSVTVTGPAGPWSADAAPRRKTEALTVRRRLCVSPVPYSRSWPFIFRVWTNAV